MPRKLKLFNGSDWEHRGGHVYIAAFSLTDAVRLYNEAYRKIHNLENCHDLCIASVHYAKEYWSKGCWGNTMAKIEVERGLWHAKAVQGGWSDKVAVRII